MTHLFFSTSLKQPLLDHIAVASVGQIFHNIVYSSFLGLLHAVDAGVISGSSRWNTEEGKKIKTSGGALCSVVA